jgi:hypothetical protein
MLSDLHCLNLKLCSKLYNKNFVLRLIVMPHLSSEQQHNYSSRTRQVGHTNEQSMYSLMSMVETVIFNISVYELGPSYKENEML